MASVIVCDYDEQKSLSHIEALRANGYAVVTSQRFNDALHENEQAGCQLLVLGLEAIKVEDEGLWGLVEKLTRQMPVIGLHDHPSEDMCQAAARAHIAAVLSRAASREVFMYAVEQLLRQKTVAVNC